MAYSRVVLYGDGSTTQFAVNFALDYLLEADVTCRVGEEVDGAGDPAYRTITFLSTNLVEVGGTVVGDGVQIVFERTVDKDELRVNFSNGDQMDEDNLDTAQKQAMMAVHEVLDGRFSVLTKNLDVGGNRVVNVGDPTDAQDVATKKYVDEHNSSTEAAAAAASAAEAAATLTQLNTDADAKIAELNSDAATAQALLETTATNAQNTLNTTVSDATTVIEAAQADTEADKLAAQTAADTAVAAAASIVDGSVVDRTSLKALDTTVRSTAILREAGREGIFVFKSGDYSVHIASDVNEGVYIKADAVAASAGAWVRLFNTTDYETKWFGAVADYATDNTALINSIIAVANLYNTNTSAGKQRAAFIHVGGGVKFATKNLTWLPASNWIFVYVTYFGNSNTSPGAGFGLGTNERETMSVNSGYPADASGGFVAEDFFHAPLHPARGVNIDKTVDSSIAAHLPTNQAIQPTATIPNRASTAWISDERLEKFRIMYQRYGGPSTTNGIIMYSVNRTTDLVATNVGVSAGWQSSSVPVAGDVVRDIITGARYVVTSLATNILSTDWLSGTAAAGNTLLRERAIFRGSISGTTLTVTAIDQGALAVGHTIVGMFSGSGVAANTTIISQSSGTAGGVGVYVVSNVQTVSATQLVSGLKSLNGIQGGGVVNTDNVYRPINIDTIGRVTFNQNVMPGTQTPFVDGSGSATGTLTNAPVAGNPTKWIFISDGGVTRRIPAW